jgi:predicted dehydrogenase
MSKIKIGFIGVGVMGQMAHLRNYVTIPDCEVVAIAELREEQGKKVAARYGIPNVYTDYREMLKKHSLDGIVAIHPFNRHGVLLPEIFEAKVPVLTEKPIASTIEAGEKIIQALEKNGIWQMLGYHKRSDPATMFAVDEIQRLKQTGELGKMKYVRIVMSGGDWIRNGFLGVINTPSEETSAKPLEVEPPAKDMDDKTFKEYVSFINVYVHQINLLRYLLGEAYSVIYADPTGVLLVARSESGIPATIEMTPYNTTVDWQESAMVCFDQGYIKLQLPAPLTINQPGRVEILRDNREDAKPQTIIPQLPWTDAMRQQAINFVRAIKGEIKPPCEARESILDLKVAKEYLRLKLGKLMA